MEILDITLKKKKSVLQNLVKDNNGGKRAVKGDKAAGRVG